MQENSVYTKIIKGELPAHKVHETERTLAVMDINPIQPGMVVVFSKQQVPNMEDLSDEDHQDLFKVAKDVSQKLRTVFPSKKKIALRVEGLDVPHAHAVVFPFDNSEEFRAAASEGADQSTLADVASMLRSA